jgi:DNA-binding MarR family transcriptional regulator/GNAT superfamily N-acetyltransferase
MPSDQISRVRSFNRAVTQRVGALADHFLDRDRPLGEARLLFEIGRAGADVRDLRTRLDLDSAYVSRLLRALERQGLVAMGANTADGRVRTARLTKAGLDEWNELDRRSDDLAASLLAALTDRQREQLVSAMGEVERLLFASCVRIEIEDPSSPAAHHCLGRYFEELQARFESGFDAARSISAGADELRLPRGLFVVARAGADAVGCGALKKQSAQVGDIKRMWVAEHARGLGLGARILAVLEREAVKLGLTVVRLETNRVLHEAQAMYRRRGYREVEAFSDEPYAHHWFAKRLVGEAPGAEA